MINSKIVIRRGAAHDSLTVVEPRGTTEIDMARLPRRDRNRLRHRVVALFEKDRELQRKIAALPQ